MKKVDYSKELLEEAVTDCYSFSELCRKLGLQPKGGNLKSIQHQLDKYDVDYSHFIGQGWRKFGNPKFDKEKIELQAVLDVNSSLKSDAVKQRLFSHHIKENKCEICGISEWNGKQIKCELHHKNGDPTDNRIENLQILCPNCHSQTSNFRNRKRK